MRTMMHDVPSRVVRYTSCAMSFASVKALKYILQCGVLYVYGILGNVSAGKATGMRGQTYRISSTNTAGDILVIVNALWRRA